MLVAACSAVTKLPVCCILSAAARAAASVAAWRSRRTAYARDPSIAIATMPIRTVSIKAIRTIACPDCR